MRYTLKNGIIAAEIDSFGAELRSVRKNDTEYMWNGDPKYWGRVSPVLFPFVGGLRDGSYKTGGREYAMSQHGFARDMEFTVCGRDDSSISFSLSPDAAAKEKYPFDFVLKITYTVTENILTVKWEVENPSDKDMYFSIGAHPAFMCPLRGGEQSDYKLKFDTDRDIEYYLLKDGLLDKSVTYPLHLNNGYADIEKGMFDRDALVVEGRQAGEISLCFADGREYVTVRTDAPLFGLWSPAGKNAPFICIEPWYGRCDALGFCGELYEREYTNSLSPGKTFAAEYEIVFGD
ncbi:MAG: aldose 1-epimerase family protein [Candidatus Ornithomonoglobus sp.]